VHALQGVSLTIRPHEVHGLLGQNGSGKSTLIKILAGYHAPEPGAVLEVHGERVRLPLQPGQFRDLGMSFVHQDLALIPSLSVTENLRLGELAAARRWHISWDRERRRAAEMFERYGVQIDPQAMVADISAIDRALLGIIRAVEDMRASQAARRTGRGLLVLDEPTAFLPRSGAEQLFALIREIVASGASVLFVSHNLDEVLRITDRITVLRDGRLVGTIRTTDATEAQLIEMIIGRRLEALSPDAPHLSSQTIAAQVEGLCGGSLHDVSIDLREGEVVGITGLLGSGFEDLPYLIFGARPATAGQLTLRGRRHDLRTMTPAQAIAQGIALVPADRQNDGSIGSLSVADNITMQVIGRYVRAMRLDRTRIKRDAQQVMQQFDVRPPEPRLVYQGLSGGNQQKVLLAKWFQTAPALILLHEPTLGVDVGARQQIYTVIRDAARAGAAVVCASADYEQLAAICDRVVIVARGRVARQLVAADLTKDRIAEQCLMSVTIRA
jgi:ribose transport system ATP-binding protein